MAVTNRCISPSYGNSRSILVAKEASAEILQRGPTRKIVQWWYTCRKESCLQDFFSTMKIVSMKSRTCFGRDMEKTSIRERKVDHVIRKAGSRE